MVSKSLALSPAMIHWYVLPLPVRRFPMDVMAS
jgi:hypothetical protein